MFHSACYSVKVLVGVLLALVAGSLVYCVLTVVAAAGYRSVRPPALRANLPISILKPLAGDEEGLEENLRSFFDQRYPTFEILLAVRSANDPAIPVVEGLRAQYPTVPSRLIVTGEAPYPNAKVYSLDRMLAAARYELVMMADSDTRVKRDLLSTLAAEFANDKVGMATCPYRVVPGRSFWSTLEAIGLNTEFLSGVLVARMLDGMKFALGPTIVARRETLDRIGGFDAVKDYLAEDFVLGKLAAQCGYEVVLSSYVIEHHTGAQPFAANLRHRLRWRRSARRSRPWGYLGQIFTHPLPLALVLCAVSPAWWPMLTVTAVFRAIAAWATAGHVLRDPLTRRLWWLVPIEDAANLLVWCAGFFGNTILWRGRKYWLARDGRFELVQ
jgi:ceramide glucosyltransferase